MKHGLRQRSGSEGFVEQIKNELRFRATSVADGLYAVGEPVPSYGDHFDREK
jgi:hypothetical protein